MKVEVLMEHDTRRLATYPGYFISGAAIGTALGVLFAPKAGSETRKDLGQWRKEKRDSGRIEYRAMKEALETGRKTFVSKEKELAGV